MTKTKLETLSTSELINLADSNGLYIPQDLDRVFIISVLLEFFEEKVKENEKPPKEELVDSSDSPRQETAMLPDHYSISYVDFLIRDPLWVFVFWEIKFDDRETYEKNPDFNGYCLRLIPENYINSNNLLPDESFTVPVEINDKKRYIGFTEHSSLTSDKYIIKLEAVCGDTVYNIAESKIFCLPRLVTNGDLRALKVKPLMHLSGITEMPVIITKR